MSLFIRAALLLLSVLVLAPVQGGAQVTLSSQELGIFTRMRDASGQNRPSLTPDPILTRVAREKAADLGRRNYFAHVNPDGHGPNWLVRQAGYRLPAFWGTGAKDNYIESIAAGNASSSSTWDQWMGSSGHRTHLLASSNFYKDQTAVGIGYASVGGSSYQHYWVVLTAPPMAAPALTIAAPANATRVTAPQVTVSGVSGGMPAAAAVQVRLTNASGVGAYRAAGGLGAWSTLVTGLTPGPNTIHVRALDASGSQLSEQARTVTYVVLKPITIAIVGEGTITAGFAGTTSREVGTAYTLTTSPAADWMFQGWTGSITSTAPRLGFVMREGLALTATFVPNPFLPHKGRYEASVGGEGAFSPETSGVLRVLLGSTGSYSGSLTFGGRRHTVRGRFDVAGNSMVTLARAGLSPLVVTLLLDLAGDGSVSGTVSDGTTTTSLSGGTALRGTTKVPHAKRGRYTIVLPPDAARTDPMVPAGHGVALLTISTTGAARLTAFLPDNTKVLASAYTSADGEMTFYALPHAKKGTLFARLRVRTSPGVSDLDGTLSWHKPSQAATVKLHREGFTTRLPAVGSLWIKPLANSTVLPVPATESNSNVVVGEGNLAGEIPQPSNLSEANKLVPTTEALPRMRTSISTTLGYFSGSFNHPETGVRSIFRGVLLATQEAGYGYFVGTDRSGYLRLTAAE